MPGQGGPPHSSSGSCLPGVRAQEKGTSGRAVPRTAPLGEVVLPGVRTVGQEMGVRRGGGEEELHHGTSWQGTSLRWTS